MWKYVLSVFLYVSSPGLEVLGQNDETGEKSCLDCHQELMANRKVHPPAEEDCSYCHEPTGNEHPAEGKRGFKLADQMPDLCYMCHDENTEKNIHAPVEAGECVMCHSPHSSPNSALLLASPIASLCFECHDRDEIMKHNVEHAAVSEGDCQNCHNPHQSNNPSLLNAPMPTLCFDCHEEIIQGQTAKYLHAPVEDDCRNCHFVHGSKEKKLLDQSVPDLCFECHDQEEIMKHNVMHQPVEDGNCLDCHNPHQSDQRAMLQSSLPDLCFTCHDQVAEEMKAKHLHPPFEDDCRNCHLVHGSTEKNLLDLSTTDLCFDCHDDVKESIDSPPVVHGAVSIKKTCANCHSPHSSQQEKFLLKENIALCLTCHNRSITTETAKLSNIRKKLDSRYVHDAIEFDGCTGCHAAHTSVNPLLLKDSFPPGPYAPAEPGSFALCFACHDEEMITAKETNSATNFRNGNQNLHFFHINGEKGRSCKDCHDMHGSQTKHLIADNVAFGSWKMPITYQATENGGSCLTGCHAKKKYSRNNSTN
ncbi:MAG: hypothetical protein L3J31_07170 [Bacteroidales bacterium]|nr:hypothetical protein [Bacteroidales bacterium]